MLSTTQSILLFCKNLRCRVRLLKRELRPPLPPQVQVHCPLTIPKRSDRYHVWHTYEARFHSHIEADHASRALCPSLWRACAHKVFERHSHTSLPSSHYFFISHQHCICGFNLHPTSDSKTRFHYTLIAFRFIPSEQSSRHISHISI